VISQEDLLKDIRQHTIGMLTYFEPPCWPDITIASPNQPYLLSSGMWFTYKRYNQTGRIGYEII